MLKLTNYIKNYFEIDYVKKLKPYQDFLNSPDRIDWNKINNNNNLYIQDQMLKLRYLESKIKQSKAKKKNIKLGIRIILSTGEELN